MNCLFLKIYRADSKTPLTGEQRFVWDGDAPTVGPSAAPPVPPEAAPPVPPTPEAQMALQGVAATGPALLALAAETSPNNPPYTAAFNTFKRDIEEGDTDFAGADMTAEQTTKNPVWIAAQRATLERLATQQAALSTAPATSRDIWLTATFEGLASKIHDFSGITGDPMTENDIAPLLDSVFADGIGTPGPFESWFRNTNATGFNQWKADTLKGPARDALKASAGLKGSTDFPELAKKYERIAEGIENAHTPDDVEKFKVDAVALKKEWDKALADKTAASQAQQQRTEAAQEVGHIGPLPDEDQAMGWIGKMLGSRNLNPKTRSTISSIVIGLVTAVNAIKLPFFGEVGKQWRRSMIPSSILATFQHPDGIMENRAEHQMYKFGINPATRYALLDKSVKDFVAGQSSEITEDAGQRQACDRFRVALKAALKDHPDINEQSTATLAQAIGGRAIILVAPAAPAPAPRVAQAAPAAGAQTPGAQG